MSLLGSVWYGIGVDQQPVSFRTYNADILPHGQIVSLSGALRDDRWVSRIVFEEGQWRADFEEIEAIILPDDKVEAQQMSDELMRIEAGIRDRLSGDEDAEIPEITRRDAPQSDNPAPTANGVELSTDEIEMFLAEMDDSPEVFIERLAHPDFRAIILDTPRLRLAGFRNEAIRGALLANDTSNPEEE
jgi:hypothetical protein